MPKQGRKRKTTKKRSTSKTGPNKRQKLSKAQKGQVLSLVKKELQDRIPAEVSRYFLITGLQWSSSINNYTFNTAYFGGYTRLATFLQTVQVIDDDVTPGTGAIEDQDVQSVTDMGVYWWGRLKITLANNTNFPVSIEPMIATPKQYLTSSEGPTTFVDEFPDQKERANNGSELVPHAYSPVYSKNLKENYTVKRLKPTVIRPGTQRTYNLTQKKTFFNRDYALTETSREFMPGQSKLFWVRQLGPIVHDSTTTTLVGYGKSELDVITVEEIYYLPTMAGAQSRYEVVDSLGNVAAGVLADTTNVDPEVFDDT